MSTATSLTADANLELLKPIRNHVKRVARSFGADADTIEDFEVVVSELATNVIEHTSASTVTVSFRREATRWILEVSGADGLGDLGPLSRERPANTALDGRGLFITHALMDTVELVDIDGQRCVRCARAFS